MKADEDYFDEKFDTNVRKDMKTAKFEAMTDEEKKVYLNEKRNADFLKMKDMVSGDNIDTMARATMDFFDIPDEKKELVNTYIKEWAGTRQKTEKSIQS